MPKKGYLSPKKGKTFEEFYGIEKAKDLSNRISKTLTGVTLIKRFGEEKAKEINEKKSKRLKGVKCPLRGRKGKHSEEHNRKVSLALLGKSSGMLGKHQSEKAKKRISLANKGKKRSLAFRKLRSNIMKNKYEKGYINPSKGKKRSIEIRKKLSLAHKGKCFTEEHKRNLSLAHKGEKAYQWKGGITPLFCQIRQSNKYRQWRQDVFIRDNFTCQYCGQIGSKLQAHHIKPFSILIKEIKENLPLLNLYDAAMIYTPLWNLNNGQTLCTKCHKQTKNYKNKRS